VSDYFNNETVREQLHIPSKVESWEQCSSKINYVSEVEASEWILPLMKDKYRILVYSGDTDGAIPTQGTHEWIQNLDWGVKEKWRPYYY
jgi:serine carboxypeptidase-like clade 2